MDIARIDRQVRRLEKGSVKTMDTEILKAALNDQQLSQQATENARSAAATAREETRQMVSRLDEKVQLEVAKAIGANVELPSSVCDPKK